MKLLKHLSFFGGIVVLFAALSSCRKEVAVKTIPVETNTTLALHDVYFVNDSLGYLCGGERWSMGVVLRTFDGGKTWSTPDSVFPVAAYAMQFFDAAQGYVAGNNSWWGYTNDTARTFNTGTSDYRPIHDIAFLDPLTGVKVGGEDPYVGGYTAYTTDGGSNWKVDSVGNNLTTVVHTGNGKLIAAGYGVVLVSENNGQTFNPIAVSGDFYQDISFPTAQVGFIAGFQGQVLKTTDGGKSFTPVRKANLPFAKREYFYAIRFWDENIGYIAGADGVMYRTLNGGRSWQKTEAPCHFTIRKIWLFNAYAGLAIGDGGGAVMFMLP